MLLRRTWPSLTDDPIGLGGKIFLHIFKERPTTKELFPFRKETGEDLLRHPQFKGHSKRFIHAVQTTIQNLDALEVVVIPTLVALGRKHVDITDHFEDYQAVFCGAIVAVFAEALGRAATKDVLEAWTIFVGFIANKLLEGYAEEKVERAAKRTNGNAGGESRCCAIGLERSRDVISDDADGERCPEALPNGVASVATAPANGELATTESSVINADDRRATNGYSVDEQPTT